MDVGFDWRCRITLVCGGRRNSGVRIRAKNEEWRERKEREEKKIRVLLEEYNRCNLICQLPKCHVWQGDSVRYSTCASLRHGRYLKYHRNASPIGIRWAMTFTLCSLLVDPDKNPIWDDRWRLNYHAAYMQDHLLLSCCTLRNHAILSMVLSYCYISASMDMV